MHEKVFSNLSFDELKWIRHIQLYMDSRVFLGIGAHAQAVDTRWPSLLSRGLGMRLGYYKLVCTVILYDKMQSHSVGKGFNAVVICCYIQCKLKDVEGASKVR